MYAESFLFSEACAVLDHEIRARRRQKMNWTLFYQLSVTAVVAFLGAFLAHFLSARRDRKNAIRKQRIDFLIDAYRALEYVANRPTVDDPKLIESPLADIQLFGSSRQVQVAQNLIREFGEQGKASLDALLEELRADLRDELKLEKVPRKVLFLRFPQKLSK